MEFISKRGIELPPSPIRKLAPFADDAIKRKIEVLHLNIGQPDILSPVESIQSLANYSEKLVKYSPSNGNLSLRESIATYFQKNNLQVDSSDIIVTNGGSEAIIMSFFAITNSGDEIIIPEPFYSNYFSFAHITGVKIVPVTCTIETNFILPEISEIEKKVSPKTKGILICNPNNPTGVVYSKEQIEELIEIAIKRNIVILADEVYRDFIYDKLTHYSLLNWDTKEIQERVIIIDSFSKKFSLCGIRVGFLITKNKAILQTCLRFAQARLSPPSIGQYMAEEALKTSNEYFIKVNNEYSERRDILMSEMSQIENLKIGRPSGAFYALIGLPIKNAENFCEFLLKDFSLNNKTIMLAPAEGFYINKHLGKSQVRIAYVLNKDKIIEASKILKEALKEYRE